MSEEEFRKIAKEYAEMYFTKGIDSTKIFKYVDELEKKVEELENKIKCAQKIEQEYSALLTENSELENIRKEAIEYINKNWGHWCSNHCKYATETINILNKGSEFRCGKN